MNQLKRSSRYIRYLIDGSGSIGNQTAAGKAVYSLHKLIFFMVLGLLAFCPPAIAQVTSGTILGDVQDTSGATVPGAKVTATALNLGITRTVTSSANGTFSLSNLPAPQDATTRRLTRPAQEV